MRKTALLILTTFLLTLPACKKDEANKPVGDNIVAIVGSKTITKAEYEKKVEQSMARYRSLGKHGSPNMENRIKENILRRMVENLMFIEKAEDLGIKVTNDEINERFNKQKAAFESEEAYKSYIKNTGTSEESLKKDISMSLLREKVIEKLAGEVVVSDEEVKSYFDANSDRYIVPEEVHARHILVRIDRLKFIDTEAMKNADSETKAKLEKEADAKAEAEAMDKIKKIKEELSKKDADFAKVAMEYSEGPTAPKGGDLGFFSKKRMVKEFSDIAFAQKDGEISDAVKTRYGYHIIQTLEHKPAVQKTFEEEKEDVRRALENRKKGEQRRNAMRILKTEIKSEILIEFAKDEKLEDFKKNMRKYRENGPLNDRRDMKNMEHIKHKRRSQQQ